MRLEPAKESLDVLIVARDIQRSLAFYQGRLGLEKVEEILTPFGKVHRLRFGTSLIKLMDPTHVPASGPVGLDQQLGIRCVCFRIRNLESAWRSLRADGVEFTMDAAEVMPGMHVAMLKDPDGNIVELIELR